MRVSTLAAIAGQCLLASAQLIDLDFINAEPDPTFTIALDAPSQTITYNRASAIAKDHAEAGSDSPLDVVEAGPAKRNTGSSGPILEARQAACAPAPTTSNIYNAVLSPPESFVADSNFAQAANQAPTPSGYTKTFTNAKAASQAHGYMGYSLLSSYDTAACAAKCTKAKLCQSFNIYFERSPSLVPGANCPNPAPTANIFCVLWGGPVYPENAKNVGQWRANYRVVIAGSNGYTQTSALGLKNTAAINSPAENCNGAYTYLGMRLFNDGAPFDAQRCAAVCSDTSSYNINHNPDPTKPPTLCKYFNTYILSRNYVSQGQVCALYSQYWDPAVYAVNDGQYDAKGNHFTISSSVFVKNATDVVTPVCPSNVVELQQDSAAGAFCTSYNSYVAPVTTATAIGGTTTVERCAALTPRAQKRDDGPGGLVEAVLAVYPEKINSHSTGAAASVTIAAESITAAAALASATAEAVSSLGMTISGNSGVTTTAPVVRRRQASVTPSILQGRDPREIASVCSRVATGTSTTTRNAQATETSDANCAQYPSTCSDGSPPTLIVGDFNRAPSNYDDYSFKVELPFPVCIYDNCSTTVHPTTNGLITLGDFETAEYENYLIPTNETYTYLGRRPALFVLWDDLYIYSGQRHYMDYSICGTPGSRSVTFDWRMGRYRAPSDGPLYSFSATLYEAQPSRAFIQYFGTTDQGNSSSVGMQGYRAGQATSYQYSYNEAVISNGLSLIFDPAAGYFGQAQARGQTA